MYLSVTMLEFLNEESILKINCPFKEGGVS